MGFCGYAVYLGISAQSIWNGLSFSFFIKPQRIPITENCTSYNISCGRLTIVSLIKIEIN